MHTKSIGKEHYYHETTEQNLDVLSKMNREKDRIEEKIRKRKKELCMSLIYNKK